MPDLNIVLPANGWGPRDYQRPLWRYLERGGKRALAVWHRRSGKDDVALHRLAVAVHERVGTYWHLLPEASQARKAIWDAVNPKTGMRRIEEAFPLDIRAATRENEMFIRFANGSTYQVVGSDNFNSLVGSPPIGVVFSEWAIANPTAWAYLRPILAENGGWALFITTPRGKNHTLRMLQSAEKNEAWFAQTLTARQTSVFSEEQLQEELKGYMDEYGEAVGLSLFEQEYLCSFEAPIVGAIYAAELRKARDEGRVCRVPYDPALKVSTWWDIGIGDSTAIWFTQQSRGSIRVIDYLVDSGKGLDFYGQALADRKYNYWRHTLPHDARARDKGSGKSYERIARELLTGTVRVAAQTGLEEGINAVRLLFPRLDFDEVKCELGLSALQHYRRAINTKTQEQKPEPVHDWASHGADALRTMAMSIAEEYAPAKSHDGFPETGEEHDWMTI